MKRMQQHHSNHHQRGKDNTWNIKEILQKQFPQKENNAQALLSPDRRY
jgi:hypothetical protein